MRSLRIFLVLTAAGCVTGRGAGDFPATADVRPARDVPPAFVISSGDAPTRDGTCRSPLTDARNALQIRLVRSMGGVGDYAVPDRQYGARGDELLRVDCRSLKPIGLVPR